MDSPASSRCSFPVSIYNLFPATGHREFLLPAQSPISVAVVGVGVFGRNHARVYKELEQQGEPVRLLGVVDPDTSRADAVAREFGCKAFGSVQQLLTTHSEVQAASVAAPTVHHLAVASELMKAGVDVLIEKPLAATLAEAEELVGLAAAHKRIAQVGHLERFNPAVRATVPLLTKPMFFEVHRLSVFTPRSLDVDVVLDLMIHDLDIVLAFAKSPVKEVRAVGLPILSGKVDIANVRLELESGCIANFTASRVSTERVRKLRFFQPRQYVSLDYGRQEVLVFTVGQDEGAIGKAFRESSDWSDASHRSRPKSRCTQSLSRFSAPCGSAPRQWFRSKMAGARWGWRWRLWRPFANTGRKWTSPESRSRSTEPAGVRRRREQPGGCPHTNRSAHRSLRTLSPGFTYVYTPKSCPNCG